jgi:hypothetical protein
VDLFAKENKESYGVGVVKCVYIGMQAGRQHNAPIHHLINISSGKPKTDSLMSSQPAKMSLLGESIPDPPSESGGN